MRDARPDNRNIVGQTESLPDLRIGQERGYVDDNAERGFVFGGNGLSGTLDGRGGQLAGSQCGVQEVPR